MDVTERRGALALAPGGAGEEFELSELLCRFCWPGAPGVGMARGGTGVANEADVDDEAEAAEDERRGEGGGRGMEATRGVDGEDIGFDWPVRVFGY